ncbi:MAG: hypothetical protein PW791_09115, partial [Neorhizobium sp.]|nr:hypothetical protein [Neorhizobium sp.]
ARAEDESLICSSCADANYLAEWIDYGREMRRRVSPEPQNHLGVKSLQWNPFRAETPFGYYHIDDQTDRTPDELKGRPPFLLTGSRVDHSRHDTLEAARSAAQAHFDHRILSCLATSEGQP